MIFNGFNMIFNGFIWFFHGFVQKMNGFSEFRQKSMIFQKINGFSEFVISPSISLRCVRFFFCFGKLHIFVENGIFLSQILIYALDIPNNGDIT